MRKNNTIQAFTLSELLVGITIIGILALGVSNLNFNRLSKSQTKEIEIIKIINLIEETKNNALIGKGIGLNGETPDSWSIVLNNLNSSGSIESIWNLGSISGSGSKWNSKKQFEITNMRCQTIDGLMNDSNIMTATINYTGSTAGITGCSDTSFKKLVFDVGTIGNTQEISINIVTGVIEKK